MISDEGSVAHYLAILREQQFSAVLIDGSILQISYDFIRENLEARRACICPLPYYVFIKMN